MEDARRRLGTTDIWVTPIAMGCWPIAGITSVEVNDADSLATLTAAFAAGIQFFDTAYAYGMHGESDRLIAKALGPHRKEIVIASKAGIHWAEPGRQVRDGRPEVIRRQCEAVLERLATDYVDLFYLHAPDPRTPIAESAGAFLELITAGKIRAAGVSNVTVAELAAFHNICPVAACQPPYNLLQREIEAELLPWCRAHDVAVVVYWPLMKGLLAGHLSRDHVFADRDGRKKYPIFQGDEWIKNQDLLDELRPIARAAGVTLAQLVLAWTIAQPGITSALCGAKRPEQIRENAGAMAVTLSEATRQAIDHALERRGPPVSRGAV